MYRHGPSCLKGPVWRDRYPHVCEAPVADPSEVRWELVERVRREIAEGAYETPEKWDAALERLLRRLEE